MRNFQHDGRTFQTDEVNFWYGVITVPATAALKKSAGICTECEVIDLTKHRKSDEVGEK